MKWCLYEVVLIRPNAAVHEYNNNKSHIKQPPKIKDKVADHQ